MYLSIVTDFCTSTRLAFRIFDLEHPQKEYSAFRFGLDRQPYDKWTYIPVMNNDDRKTEICVFLDLNEDTPYYVQAEVCCKEEWIPVIIGSGVYLTQERLGADRIPLPPLDVVPASGSLSSRSAQKIGVVI